MSKVEPSAPFRIFPPCEDPFHIHLHHDPGVALLQPGCYVQFVGREKGLGQSAISAMIEDHEGIVWIGTQLGLLRFDGLQSISFLPEKGNPNSISNEYINDLFEDKNHTIWVATRNGLNSIDPSRKKIKKYYHDSDDPSSLPNNGVYKLQPNSDSTFFIMCSRGGFAEFNIKDNTITRLNPLLRGDTLHRPYEDRFVVDIFKTPHYSFAWTNRGFFQYLRDENVLIDVADSITGFDVHNVFPNYYLARDGDLWMTDEFGTLVHWSPYKSVEMFCDQEIERSFLSGDFIINDFDPRHLIVTSNTRMLLIDKVSGDVTKFNVREDQRNNQSHHVIKSVIRTSKGIILMATSQGNLLMLDPLHQQFRYVDMLVQNAEGLAMGEVNDFFEDAVYKKRYISSLLDSLFYVEDLVTGRIERHYKRKVPNMANRWMLDAKGRLWLCDGNLVLEVNRSTQKTKAYMPSTPALNISDMAEYAPGQMLVISYLHGLFRFIPDSGVFEKVMDERGWKQSKITCIEEDRRNKAVWIGTIDDGLYRYDAARDTFYHYENHSRNPASLGGDWIRDITFDSLGFAWFAVEPIGLSRYDYQAVPDSAFRNLTMADGLPSSFVSGIATDVQGNIWMTTMNGIGRLNPKDFTIKQFKKVDGLPSSKFSKSSIEATTGNIILVGSRNGYFYFNPNTIRTNVVAPNIVIQDVISFDKSRLTEKRSSGFAPVNLKFRENYLTIRFSVINFTDPERNTVRYTLEGLDERWYERTGIAEINYTKIPPGDYRFRIKAANNDGIWNQEETIIPIHIKPAFWQTTWFYFLIGAGIASLVIAFYNFKLKQKLKQSRLIAEREFVRSESERQLSQLEMTALRAQMNPHFVFNCLNSINRFIVVNDNEAASEYLTKFSKLIRQVLDNSRGEKILLSTEIDTLKLYIDMESLRFNNKFEYAINVDPEIDPMTMTIQPMLIQPYVENAIWHGLMHRKTKGILKIHFEKRTDSLAVTIMDNGVGRVMAKKIKDGQLITRKSHGMKVTAQRMALLSKKLNVPVEAQVEDLYDDEHNATGTRVHLILPLEKVNHQLETNPTITT